MDYETNVNAANYSIPIRAKFFSGEGGIRTLGGHKAHNGFRDRPIQPLWHLPRCARFETRERRRL